MVNCINTVNGPVWSRLINFCNVYLYVNFMYICMYICTGMYICMYMGFYLKKVLIFVFHLDEEQY